MPTLTMQLMCACQIAHETPVHVPGQDAEATRIRNAGGKMLSKCAVHLITLYE